MTPGPAKTDTCVDCVCLTASHDNNGCNGDGDLSCPVSCDNRADFQEPDAAVCELCMMHFSVGDILDPVVVAVDEGIPEVRYQHRDCHFGIWVGQE